MISFGEWDALRCFKVGATLLCAFGMGHIMQTYFGDRGNPHHQSAETYALENIEQTSAANTSVDVRQRFSPYSQVVHTREISLDMPSPKLPTEVPSPSFDLTKLSI
jgi:uncharacterized membrane protein YraQ (UPF0718 family)